MIFTIQSTLSGLSINSDIGDYNFSSKLFSHSSTLIDKDSNLVVSINRKSWWKMDFDLIASNQSYQLAQRFSKTVLIASEQSDETFINEGFGFYKLSRQITKVDTLGAGTKRFSVFIDLDEKHYIALLASICLELNCLTNG